MEMGTQTNEQPVPGSALRVFINRDAEALMALIFQAEAFLSLPLLLLRELGRLAPAVPTCGPLNLRLGGGRRGAEFCSCKNKPA